MTSRCSTKGGSSRAGRRRTSTPAAIRSSRPSCARKEAADGYSSPAGRRRRLRDRGAGPVRDRPVHDWRTAARLRPESRSLYGVPDHHRPAAWRDRARLRRTGRLGHRYRGARRPSGKFRARLEITEDLHQLVRTDSVAAIQTEGLVGGSFLAVSMGTAAAPRAPAGSTIPSREPFLLADMFEQVSGTIGKVNATIDTLGVGIEKTLTSVDTTVGSANALIVAVSDDVKTLASASARIHVGRRHDRRGAAQGRGNLRQAPQGRRAVSPGDHHREDRRDHRRRCAEGGAAGEAGARRAECRGRAGHWRDGTARRNPRGGSHRDGRPLREHGGTEARLLLSRVLQASRLLQPR